MRVNPELKCCVNHRFIFREEVESKALQHWRSGELPQNGRGSLRKGFSFFAAHYDVLWGRRERRWGRAEREGGRRYALEKTKLTVSHHASTYPSLGLHVSSAFTPSKYRWVLHDAHNLSYITIWLPYPYPWVPPKIYNTITSLAYPWHLQFLPNTKSWRRRVKLNEYLVFNDSQQTAFILHNFITNGI